MGEDIPSEIKNLPKDLISKGLFTKYKKLSKIVLFLGSTGKGKSSTTEILRGNPELLAEGENGGYLIVDKSDRISGRENTILSKTTLPDPVWYEGLPNDTCLLDCPGFEDTRSSAMDILCAIYTTEAIKNCHSAKIALVLSYDDVKEGGDRKAFINLVKILSEFTTTLDKFKNSIALIVTKVPNLVEFGENNKPYFIPDEKMKKNIVSFLLNVQKTIESELYAAKEHETTYKNSLKMIDMILPKIGNTYDSSKIAMIRCPKMRGLIHNMSEFQQARANLHDLIHKKLKFANLDSSDFQCSISTDSKLYLEKVVHSNIDEVSLVVRVIIGEIEKSYEKIEVESTDIQALHNEFRVRSDVWRKSLQQIQNQRLVTEFLEYFLKNVASLVVGALTDQSDPLKKALDDLKQMTQLMHLLEKVSNKKYNISTQELFKLFNNMTSRVHESSIWYAALLNVAETSESYEVQQKLNSARSKFFDKLQRWTLAKEAAPIPGKTIQDALFEVCQTNIKYHLDFLVSLIKLKHLVNLSEQAFKEITVVSNQESCRIQGHFVMLSAVIPKIGKAKRLEILATYKLFIDCDIDAVGKELKVFVIAPVCEVIGDLRKVNLNGADGLSYDYPAASIEMARIGSDGESGGPGGNGGVFIIIGHDMVNGDNLIIDANGGKGGKGQNGARGSNGKAGIDAALQSSHWKLIKNQFFSNEYLLRGTDGIPGNNGGNGGKGGVGGKAGDVFLHGLIKDNSPCTSAKNGEIGENGKGGPAGVGGQHGNHLVFTVESGDRHLSFEKFEKCKKVYCRGKSQDGVAGRDGIPDEEGHKSTRQPMNIFPSDLESIIATYKPLYQQKTKYIPRYSNHSTFMEIVSDHLILEKYRNRSL